MAVASAADAAASGTGSNAEELAQIAEALAYPFSYLRLMFTQNDTIWYSVAKSGEETS